MRYNEFVQKLDYYSKKHDMLFSPKPLLPEQIAAVEAEVQAKFGPELQDFLTGLGCIVYVAFETYGINATHPINTSTLVKASQTLHKHFKITTGMTAITYDASNSFYLVDSRDQVYYFCPEDEVFESTDMDLFDFLLFMLQDALEFANEFENES